MLNIGKLAGVDSVDYYVSQVASGAEDYYLGNGEAPGVWTGTAAGHLGLQGQVDAQTLRQVLGGNNAAGVPLEGLRSSRKIPGFDLAFRAPKSVTLLCALGGSDVAADVRDAHDTAVAAALGYPLRAIGSGASCHVGGCAPGATDGISAQGSSLWRLDVRRPVGP